MSILRTAAGCLFAWSAFAATIVPGDARRGEQLFRTEQCIQCHSLNGTGGKSAPDLARRIGRNFTPDLLASLMWNHAPSMWAGMKKQGIVKAQMSDESAADLFAYFISARYFDTPGDAGRGKAAFASKHCADCHGLTDSRAEGAPAVAKWESLSDPIVLAQQMWNHGPRMKEAFARRNLSWASVTGQELTDILVYLKNLPETRHLATSFVLPRGNAGEALFQSKGCAGCHAGNLALESRLRNQTLTQIAAAMWNHQPAMKPTPLTQDEMAQILSHVWARQYFVGGGNASRGRRVFADKNCAGCHDGAAGGAPKLSKGDGYSGISMVTVLWEHGPRMQEAMNQKKVAWPRFDGTQMSDLIAYLNSL